MSHAPKRTNTDFSQMYTTVRGMARRHGVEPNDEAFINFAKEVAEYMAEDVATVRNLYNLIHLKEV